MCERVTRWKALLDFSLFYAARHPQSRSLRRVECQGLPVAFRCLLANISPDLLCEGKLSHISIEPRGFLSVSRRGRVLLRPCSASIKPSVSSHQLSPREDLFSACLPPAPKPLWRWRPGFGRHSALTLTREQTRALPCSFPLTGEVLPVTFRAIAKHGEPRERREERSARVASRR